MAPKIPPGISLSNPSTKMSPPNPLKTREKSEAPIRMRKIIDVISVVFWAICLTKSREIVLALMANKIAPSAPIPAASVGVATPNKIDPSTETISSIGGSKDLRV